MTDLSSKDQERIDKALDTLAEICDLPEEDCNDRTYQRRGAAEEILRHYRENEMVKNIHITVNGAVPVRPMTRGEVTTPVTGVRDGD